MAVPPPPVGPDELEERARGLLPKTIYDYIAGGAEDEVTLAANRAAYLGWRFRYRVLAGSGEPDLGVDLMGSHLSLPVLLAPTAVQRCVHPEGELATARAAARAGTVFIPSTLASCSLEAVAQAAPGDRWFQLYVYADRGVTADLVDRAVAAGYRALVLTVDLPVLGRRERDLRNAFTLPEGVDYANLAGPARRTGEVVPGDSGLDQYVNARLDPSLTWADLEWLVDRAGIPVLVKGVVRGDDAASAMEGGAAGVIVSNHGGRQLDSAVATLDVLPEVVDAVAGRVPVLIDGGVRRGTDALKALCLGAVGVLVGRQYVWALASGGETGVYDLLQALAEEIRVGMTLLGARGVADLRPDLLARLG